MTDKEFAEIVGACEETEYEFIGFQVHVSGVSNTRTFTDKEFLKLFGGIFPSLQKNIPLEGCFTRSELQ